MQDYDVALKLLLQGSARLTMLAVIGGPIEKWLNIELPKVQNLRADLLGETADGELVHVELQSANDSTMPLRMAEYCLGVFRQFKKFPRQIVLYVGEAPLGMESALSGRELSFRYRTIDIRDLDGDRLLESEETGDNVIAILARLRDKEGAVRKIVGRIAKLPAGERDFAFQQLILLAGLRRLSKTVEKETRTMPIYIDLLENEVIGPAYKRGLEEGELKGKLEGELKGKLEGELKIIRQLIEKRFGPIPGWAEERLAARSVAGLEELSGRILDVTSLEDLFQ
jgi:predicted transposase YdaD